MNEEHGTVTSTLSALRSVAKAAIAPAAGALWPRWVFLRALGVIFFSAFYSLAFQIHGLIGERGVLPIADYLAQIRRAAPGGMRFWYVPSVFWASSSDRSLTIVVAAGLAVSVLLTLNLWPKASVAICTLLFLSCVTTLQDFSSYQSDGMLLEAGVISIFFAPRGLRPGLGGADGPSRISLFMLRWEWFRIYFESGVVKIASGDPHWRKLTAMDDYYQNGPLPAWPGWYVQQHLPHGVHAATALLTLVVELAIVWALFLPRPFRRACCVVVTALQLGIIATANYAFLNYLVLILGILLLDDDLVARRRPSAVPAARTVAVTRTREIVQWAQAAVLCWIFYATLIAVPGGGFRIFPALPARLLEPFRIANGYGLFATMTPARFEIEFQGSNDGGKTWVAYPFRYKPQDPMERPGIYAPYQPRFEWNLWFASLGPWRASPWVVVAQERLLEGSPGVLALFRRDPFSGAPPLQVRTVLWQYWFTDPAVKERTGAWWRREQIGVFAGVLTKQPDGRFVLTGPR